MKKVLIVMTTLLLVGCYPKENSLMDYGDNSKISISNIKSIDIVRYTEGGLGERTITEESEIKSTYEALKNKRLEKETNQACDDNTTIYKFNLVDSSTISIELECEWVVIGDKRYLLK